jgi:hypothetical protein
MNSVGFFAAWSKACHSPSYTGPIMTEQNATHGRLYRCRREGNSLGQSRLAMSEVQICGIPKPSLGEVAPTP